MTAPTFTIVYTPTRTLGVFSDGRVCEMRETHEADRGVHFVAIGHADHAALWPDAPIHRRATDFADALAIVPPRAD